MREINPFRAIESQQPAPAARQRVVVRAMAAPKRWYSGIAKACRTKTPAMMEKFLFFGGLSAITTGCWMAWHPLGPLVGGGVAVWLSLLMSIPEEKAGK